jgi:hypothetical protein
MARVAKRDQRVSFTQRAPRNWAAVLLTVLSVSALVFSVAGDVLSTSAAAEVLSILQFLFEYFPGALFILVALVTLTYGTRRLSSIAGPGRTSRASMMVWTLLSTASQVAFMGILFGDRLTFVRAQAVQEWGALAAFFVGLVVAVFVYRAKVVAGFPGVAMFIAVAGAGITLILIITTKDAINSIWDLPRLTGLIVLGIAWWHAGISTTHPAGQG